MTSPESTSDYVCPQCGPDPRGGEAHALSHHTIQFVGDEPVEPTPSSLDIEHAEMYRWLREQTWFSSPLCVVMNPKQNLKLGSDCPSFSRLDEYIRKHTSPGTTRTSKEVLAVLKGLEVETSRLWREYYMLAEKEALAPQNSSS